MALLVALTSGHVEEDGDSDEVTVEVEQTEGDDIVTVSHFFKFGARPCVRPFLCSFWIAVIRIFI